MKPVFVLSAVIGLGASFPSLSSAETAAGESLVVPAVDLRATARDVRSAATTSDPESQVPTALASGLATLAAIALWRMARSRPYASGGTFRKR
jgi:hypothetical protein